jgi:hypothetical protein
MTQFGRVDFVRLAPVLRRYAVFMTQTMTPNWTGRAALALLGAGAAAVVGFAAPAAAEPTSGSGSNCASVNTSVTAGGSQSSVNPGGGCIPNTSGANGIGPGGPAYNGTDPRS